jgi:hypothetical protein
MARNLIGSLSIRELLSGLKDQVVIEGVLRYSSNVVESKTSRSTT